MQKFQRTRIFILLLLCAPSILAASLFDGDWFGGFELPESHVIVQIHFRTANDRTTGKIDVLDMGKKITMIEGSPLDKVELDPSHVHFELADKARPLSFDGQITNGVMTGAVQDSGVTLPFRLDLMPRSALPDNLTNTITGCLTNFAVLQLGQTNYKLKSLVS